MSDDATLDDFLDAGETGECDAEAEDANPTDVETEATRPTDVDTDDADMIASRRDDVGASHDESATSPGETPSEDAPQSPATPTYAWSADGGPCDACGAVVETRWRDDTGLVCSACKEW